MAEANHRLPQIRASAQTPLQQRPMCWSSSEHAKQSKIGCASKALRGPRYHSGCL
jgi:hypothetical protein